MGFWSHRSGASDQQSTLQRNIYVQKPSDAEQPRILIFVFVAMKSLAARTRWATQQFICEHLFAAGYHKKRPSFW
jgi:hypothetical protein